METSKRCWKTILHLEPTCDTLRCSTVRHLQYESLRQKSVKISTYLQVPSCSHSHEPLKKLAAQEPRGKFRLSWLLFEVEKKEASAEMPRHGIMATWVRDRGSMSAISWNHLLNCNQTYHLIINSCQIYSDIYYKMMGLGWLDIVTQLTWSRFW